MTASVYFLLYICERNLGDHQTTTTTTTTTMNESTNGSDMFSVSSLFDLPPEGSLYYKIEGILAMFYLVHPKRTMNPTVDAVPNFFSLAMYWAPLTFLLEYIGCRIKGLPGYRWNDSLAGMSALIAAAIPQVYFEYGIFYICTWIHENFRLADIPYDSWWTWLVCILATDLSLYVTHRTMHEVNFLWAAHQLHHSSEYYNLFSPARNSFVDKLAFGICVIPWSFLLPPGPLRAHHQLNFIYQFWIHTQVVGDMGALEYLLVTPKQHAVHHGRNRWCIDVNYGGFLCIWDRLFNTLVWPRDHTDKKIYFGLTHPVASWDVVYLYGHSFRDIFRRAGEYEGLENKLSVVFKGPGWEPGKPRLGNLEDIPEEPEDKTPYDKESPLHVYLYCAITLLFSYYFCIALTNQFKLLPWYLVIVGLIFAFWTVADVGYILEHRSFLPRLEWLRCIVFFVIVPLFADNVLVSFGPALTPAKIWFGLCVVIWAFNLNYFDSKSENSISNINKDKLKTN